MILQTRATMLGAIGASVATYFNNNMGQPHLQQQALGMVVFEQYSDNDVSAAALRVRQLVSTQLDRDPSLTGPFIRLAFHDATTFEPYGNGGAGSNGSIRYELDWSENRALQRPLDLVLNSMIVPVEDDEDSKSSTAAVPLSLADTIALAGAEAVTHAGGPAIAIRLGRKDVDRPDPRQLVRPLRGRTERSVVRDTMPSAGLDSDGLRLYFQQKFDMTEMEWVALCGVHGLGRHVSLLNMTKSCLRDLTRQCLEDAPVSLPFVTQSVDHFDNSYFKALLRWNNREVELGEVAFIPTDVALVVDAGLRRHVEDFARDQGKFERHFVTAYQKLVEQTTQKGTRRY